MDLSESIDKASSSLRELIEDAKKKLEDSCGDLSGKEDSFRQKAVNTVKEPADEVEIKVDIPAYNNPYDTQNLQAALAKNLSEFMEEEKQRQRHCVLSRRSRKKRPVKARKMNRLKVS